MQHFNGLTEAEQERLALLAEECAEVIQAVMKVIRHGYESHNPISEDLATNRQLLEKELGHVRTALMLLTNGGDLDNSSIVESGFIKLQTIQQWLHHQVRP